MNLNLSPNKSFLESNVSFWERRVFHKILWLVFRLLYIISRNILSDYMFFTSFQVLASYQAANQIFEGGFSLAESASMKLTTKLQNLQTSVRMFDYKTETCADQNLIGSRIFLTAYEKPWSNILFTMFSLV